MGSGEDVEDVEDVSTCESVVRWHLSPENALYSHTLKEPAQSRTGKTDSHVIFCLARAFNILKEDS